MLSGLEVLVPLDPLSKFDQTLWLEVSASGIFAGSHRRDNDTCGGAYFGARRHPFVAELL